MRCRLLAVVTGAVATLATGVLADTSKGALAVSVTVTRSCRVTTDAPAPHVDCGTRPQPVQIVSTSSSTDQVVPSPSHATRAVTIEF
jgi:hypothetical protein